MGLSGTPQLAVVGAGIAGLSCAAALQEAGCAVTLHEKSRGPSGRMSTRKTETWQCDHGARSFTATDPAFQRELSRWTVAGLAAVWQPRLARHDGCALQPVADEVARYVGVPGMNAIGHALAGTLGVRKESTVESLIPEGAGWLLQTQEAATHQGPYAAVLLAIPAPQAAALLHGADPSLQAVAAGVQMRGCWTLMLQYCTAVDLPYDALQIENSPLAWAARDSSKPGRRGAESWVLQATAEWSEAHLEAHPQQVAQALLEAFSVIGGVLPDAWTAHRWRYSDCANPLTIGACWNAGAGLGLCGDWLNRGGVEGAWLSGRALAGQVLASLAR